MASDDLHIMSYDAVMARIGANVHATTSDLDLTNVVVLFNSPGRVPSESWMLALILRYCEDVGASDTPDVFGKAVSGFTRVFAMNSSYFPFERQLGKCNVVGWACWTAWCMSARNMYAVNRVMSSAFRETRTIGLTTKAMVLCHVPGEALGVDEATVLLSGALELYDDANKNSYFCSYYKRQVAQRCIAVIGRISDAKEQLSALAMLADLRAGGSGQREQFVLAAAAALTKQGTRILSPAASVLLLRVLSASTQRHMPVYGKLLQTLMGLYTAMPAYADRVLEDFDGHPPPDPWIELAVLLPAIHELKNSTIVNKLTPRCLYLLSTLDGGRSADLPTTTARNTAALPLLLDVFCAVFSSNALTKDDVASIGLSFVDLFPRKDASISLGVSALCACLDGAGVMQVLDRLVQRASDGCDGSFRALAVALGVLNLEDVPGLCERLAKLVAEGHGERSVIEKLVAGIQDVTRKEYLVAWVVDISDGRNVHSNSSELTQ